MNRFQRILLVVLDSCGIGRAPDAAAFGDAGANTLANLARACGGLTLPHLQALGLGNIEPLRGVPATPAPLAAFGRMVEQSPGKDTTTGHWELAGLILKRPFPLFPHGFPPEIIEPFERVAGKKILGNKPASGTEIIAELGEEHLRSGRPIVYTSADSVFQIAAHEEVIPLPEIYRLCREARKIGDRFQIGRIIARPFVGQDRGSFRRTANRHDFSLPPSGPTILDHLQRAGLETVGIGKISDIFAGQGLTHSLPTRSNADGMEKIAAALEEHPRGLLFANLVDFDMIFGHRRDVEGYRRGLEAFDCALPSLLDRLSGSDLLFITADHGCDPTFSGTDHTRETVPLLAYSRRKKSGADLGRRDTFADVAATIAENFSLPLETGTSFGELLR